MAIYLPETTASTVAGPDAAADRRRARQTRVGQSQAKRAVAIALRNRMRRQKLPPELAEEIAPKNILMIGPTGVGKTEIARRLAKLAQSPFIKVEASKFTEVGYVGRDVESMVRDLVEIVGRHGQEERRAEVRGEGEAGGRGTGPRPAAAAAAARRRVRRAGLVDPGAGAADAREAARAAARGAPRSQAGRDRRAREVLPLLRDHRRIVGRGSRHQREGHAARALPGAHQEAAAARSRGARGAARRKKSRSSSTWRASRARRSTACSRRASSSSTRSTRSRGAKAATAPTSAARACSATSCRSSRARPSTRNTGW